MPEPFRGEVWDLNLDPIVGREQAGSRPALILSVDLFNQGPAELVVVIPVTRTQNETHHSLRPTRFAAQSGIRACGAARPRRCRKA